VADVRLREAQGVDVVGLVPHLPPPDVVGQAHDAWQVARAVEDEAVLEGQAPAREDLVGDPREVGVAGDETLARHRRDGGGQRRHEWIALPATARDASLKASESVGWANTVAATSSADAPK